MGLFKLYNCCVPCLLDHLKSYLLSESRLHISEFSGYHCICYEKTKKFKLKISKHISCTRRQKVHLCPPEIEIKYKHISFLGTRNCKRFSICCMHNNAVFYYIVQPIEPIRPLCWIKLVHLQFFVFVVSCVRIGFEFYQICIVKT